ncbi:sulfatase [uncultured Draconibacterium sp.]|uniref:sulfatase n=1 Tax=uncultured Draconibacterium sp. TaxID=1573823 RepID=UPI0025DB8D63|nr:sulfatase [uncultured Draconibacterium sp.]
MKNQFNLILLIIFVVTLSCTKKEEQSKHPNILLLCIDDLRPELKSFGADYIHSPNIDALAAKGVCFQQHYVNAPSCGPSRYTLLTGTYGPAGNDALFLRAENLANNTLNITPSMPEWFKAGGYTTVSVGKVSHHPGGRGGADWNDSTKIEVPGGWDKHLMPVGEWQHPRGAMHGLAHGEIRENASEMALFQSTKGPDTIYPDGLIAQQGIKQLQELAKQEAPFFLAIGLIKPHLPFGAPARYMSYYKDVELPAIQHPEKPEGNTTWHASGEFMKYKRWGKDPREDLKFADEVRRHYAACVSYADHHVGMILDALKESGADKNTIVVLWGDHGWHLGEHAIWGKHSLFEEALHSPLIIYNPESGNAGNRKVIVETADIFPTLCDLTGIEKPGFVHGKSLETLIENDTPDKREAFAYLNGRYTLRTDQYRLIYKEKDQSIELYDHTTPEAETKNIASKNEGIVTELLPVLRKKMQQQTSYK